MVVRIEDTHIKLDQLLKLVKAVASGGEAKNRIVSGEVSVNGEQETRRGRKVRLGDVVSIEGFGEDISVEAVAED